MEAYGDLWRPTVTNFVKGCSYIPGKGRSFRDRVDHVMYAPF